MKKTLIVMVVGAFLIIVIQNLLGIKVTSNVIPQGAAIIINIVILGLFGAAIAHTIEG